MSNSAQVIVTGFHRSGTSMAMQSLKKAGLHIGDSLLDATPSNPDGHFEDVETVELHDKWLEVAGTDWCCTEQPPQVAAEVAKSGIASIGERLGADHAEWGLKDPRAALYLSEWFTHLSNPYSVLVYRHYASCASSLQRRQASMLFTQPSNQSNDIRFWTDPYLALKSWLVHNRAVLKHLKDHPDRCVLVSQESQIAGVNLPSLVESRIPVKLRIDSDTGVDGTKTTSENTINLSVDSLQHQLEDTWNELQDLSLAPAEKHPTVEWIPVQEPSDQALNTSLQQLYKSWDELGVSNAC